MCFFHGVAEFEVQEESLRAATAIEPSTRVLGKEKRQDQVAAHLLEEPDPRVRISSLARREQVPELGIAHRLASLVSALCKEDGGRLEVLARFGDGRAEEAELVERDRFLGRLAEEVEQISSLRSCASQVSFPSELARGGG